MVRIPYESRAIHRPKQSQQKASSCQKNGARVVSHSGERTVRIHMQTHPTALVPFQFSSPIFRTYPSKLNISKIRFL